ncbi:MAG: hypothetical protein HY696_01940 [Deltaproteobacteria bacterium]|nr:hypothetical protein [Deltaproteobacteria bacterium]
MWMPRLWLRCRSHAAQPSLPPPAGRTPAVPVRVNLYRETDALRVPAHIRHSLCFPPDRYDYPDAHSAYVHRTYAVQHCRPRRAWSPAIPFAQSALAKVWRTAMGPDQFWDSVHARDAGSDAWALWANGPFPRLAALLHLLRGDRSPAETVVMEYGTGRRPSTVATALAAGLRVMSVDMDRMSLQYVRGTLQALGLSMDAGQFAQYNTAPDSVAADIVIWNTVPDPISNAPLVPMRAWDALSRNVALGGWLLCAYDDSAAINGCGPSLDPLYYCPQFGEQYRWLLVDRLVVDDFTVPSDWSHGDSQYLDLWYRVPPERAALVDPFSSSLWSDEREDDGDDVGDVVLRI